MNIITKLNNVYMFKNYIFVYNVYDSLHPTNSKAHQKFYKRKEFQHQNYSVGRAFEMTMHAHVSRIGLHVVQTMSLCYLSLQRSIYFFLGFPVTFGYLTNKKSILSLYLNVN